MDLRFIEFMGDIYVVVGHTFERRFDPPEVFVAVPISLCRNRTITRDLIERDSVNIPMAYAEEITDKDRIITLMLLYESGE